jgi:prolyl 4-hydroxylase
MTETADISCVYLKREPDVFYVNRFISDRDCQHIIDTANPLMKDSLVSDGKKGQTSQGRTSKNAWINHKVDPIFHNIATRIADEVGIALENAEAFQVIHYDMNGEYKRHYDAWEHDNSEKTLRCMKYGGNRLKTALVYLNDVESGGSTNFPKLQIDVSAEKGKLLVFENTYKNTNVKHPLSEHAGMPVKKGEKYAVNLWFRECSFKRLYSDFRPSYYTNDIKTNSNKGIDNESVKMEISEKETKDETDLRDDGSIMLSPIECSGIIDYMEKNEILKKNGKYTSGWLKKTDFPTLMKAISSTYLLNESEFENINVYKYEGLQSHGPFLDAYDIRNEKGREYINKSGQRMVTMCIALNNSFEIQFVKTNETKYIKTGSLYKIDNMRDEFIRNDDVEKRVNNNHYKASYMMYLHVRKKFNDILNIVELTEKTLGKEPETVFTNTMKTINTEQTKSVPNKEVTVTELENYTDTYKHILNEFENGNIKSSWRSYKSFCYNMKGPFDQLKNSVLELKNCVDTNKGLKQELLEAEYEYGEATPLKIEHVIHDELLDVLQKYYTTTIDSGVFQLGDRQSNRFKQHNEPFSRFLHYEILPLVEKINGKPMKPSYTYLSAYTKESDLPPHTDRPECECTVSFVVNKPKDLYWPIYFHKVKQPQKYKGRYYVTVDKNECIPIDCEAGGLMMFDGTDHLHFRDELEGDFYHILLLHYMSV